MHERARVVGGKGPTVRRIAVRLYREGRARSTCARRCALLVWELLVGWFVGLGFQCEGGSDSLLNSAAVAGAHLPAFGSSFSSSFNQRSA